MQRKEYSRNTFFLKSEDYFEKWEICKEYPVYQKKR